MEIFAWFFLIQAGIIGAILGYFFANKIIGNGEFLYSFLGGLIFIVIAFLIESAIIPFFVILFKIYDILCENLPAKGKTEALTLVERINSTERSDNIKINKHGLIRANLPVPFRAVNQSKSDQTEHKKVCFAQIFRLFRPNTLAKTRKNASAQI